MRSIGPISSSFSHEEIAKILAEQMPGWKAACENPGAEVVLLTQAAFGYSLEEIVLLAVAVKYAGTFGKTVTIVPQETA